jgi:hypothetical protein
MPDRDPVAERLQQVQAPNAVRADVWDAFQQATSADDFAQKVKEMAIPNEVKADLWDLKQAMAPTFRTTNEVDATGDPVVRLKTESAAEGDQLLANIRNIGGFAKDVAVGAGKSLLRSGIRGGELLRKIPGVDAVSPKFIPLKPSQVESANTGQTIGGLVEQGAELLAPTRAVEAAGVKASELAAPYLTRVLSPKLAALIPKAAVSAAGNAALVKAQGGSNTAAGVTAGVSAAVPTIGMVASKIADTLKSSAEVNVGKFFNPTTKPFKAIVEKRTPEILDRGSEVLGALGRTRAGAVDVFDAARQQAGEAIDEALSVYGSDTVQDAPQRLMAALDTAKARYVKTRIVSAAEAAALPPSATVVGSMPGGQVQIAIALNPAKVKQIDGLKQIVQAHGNDMSVDDLVGLRRAWDEIAYATPSFGQIGPTESAKWAKKMGGDAIRSIVQSDRPDLAALNREFAFWKDLDTVMTATVLRKTGQVGGLLAPMAEGAGQVAGAAIKGSLGQAWAVGKVAKLAQQVLASPRYQSLSANVKTGIADAIISGQRSGLEGWLRTAAGRLGIVEGPRAISELNP